MEKDENTALTQENDQLIDEKALTDGLVDPIPETDEDGDKTPKEGQTKKQSKEENAKYAELRRQREKAELQAKQEKEAREKEIYDKGYRKAQIDSVKTNPYTGEEITNNHDLDIYLKMKEFDDLGKDPLKEFPKYLSKTLTEADEKSKAEEEKLAKEKETKEAETKALNTKIATEREELLKAHPDLKLNDLRKNEDFLKYANGKFGRWTYLEIYDGWLKESGASSTNKPKPKSSNTSVPGGSKVVKSFKDMTDDEYEEYSKRVHGSF